MNKNTLLSLTVAMILQLIMFPGKGQLLPLTEGKLTGNEKGGYKISLWAKQVEKDFKLKHPGTAGEPCYYNKIVYQQGVNRDSVISLYCIFWADKKGNVSMIFDKNQDENLSNDSVYYIPASFYYDSAGVYRNAPFVVIDSLRYIDSSGVMLYTSCSFRACPLGLPNTGQKIWGSTGRVTLSIIPQEYIAANFTLENSSYELRIFKEPITAAIKNKYPGLPRSMARDMTMLYAKSEGKIASMEDYKSLAIVLRDSIVKIKGKSYEMYSVDSFTNSFYFGGIRITKIDTLKKMPSITGYSLSTDQDQYYDFAWYPYTIVYFTGSWCKPCEEAFADINTFYNARKQNIQVIGIAKETSPAKARTYYQHKHITWELFYESLDCNQAGCLDKAFGVSVYPTFFLISGKGEILKTSDGNNGMKEITAYLYTLEKKMIAKSKL